LLYNYLFFNVELSALKTSLAIIKFFKKKKNNNNTIYFCNMAINYINTQTYKRIYVVVCGICLFLNLEFKNNIKYINN
jgi:hypothetical protein